MSVTFSIVNGPTVVERERCFQCEQMRDHGMSGDCNLPFCEDGWVESEEAEFSYNLANESAAAVMRSIGLESGPSGEIAYKDLGNVRQAIVSARNRDRQIEPHTIPAEDRKEPGRARWITGGLDADGIRDRLMWLDLLLDRAQTLGLGVCWG